MPHEPLRGAKGAPRRHWVKPGPSGVERVRGGGGGGGWKWKCAPLLSPLLRPLTHLFTDGVPHAQEKEKRRQKPCCCVCLHRRGGEGVRTCASETGRQCGWRKSKKVSLTPV